MRNYRETGAWSSVLLACFCDVINAYNLKKGGY